MLVECQAYAAHRESKWPVYATVPRVKRKGQCLRLSNNDDVFIYEILQTKFLGRA